MCSLVFVAALLASAVSSVWAFDIPDEEIIAARTPEVKILIVGVAPRLINEGLVDTNIVRQSSSGLNVVGVGEVVYVAASVGSLTGTSFQWSIPTKPTGSTAAIVDADKVGKMFTADVLGDYTVQLKITHSKGDTTLTQNVVAAKYVGYERCAQCHANLPHAGFVDEYKQTGHFSMLQRALSGTLSNHYTGACVRCHSLSSNTSNLNLAVKNNDGWEDVADSLGWTFPGSLTQGTWVQDSSPSTPDAVTVGNWSLDLEGSAWDSLPAPLKKLAGIQCESCHGPGSAHASTANTAKIGKSIGVGVCARCHDDGHYHNRPEEWEHSGHGRVWSRNTASCSVCHTGSGFLLTTGEGLKPYDDASIVPASFELGVTQTCATCHNPHSVAKDHQLRFSGEVTLEAMQVGSEVPKPITFDLGNGAMCAQCHNLRPGANAIGTSIHHSHQTEMVLGVGGHHYPDVEYSSGSHKFMENACVTCHMSAAPAGGELHLGGHSWAMNYAGPDSVLGTSDDIHNTTGCANCHGPITDFDVNGAQDEIEEMLVTLADLLPKVAGDPTEVATFFGSGHGAAERDMTDAELRAAWNQRFVHDDGSMGVHNFVYARQLLASALKAMEGTAPAALAGDFNGSGRVDFADLFLFLQHFNTSASSSNWDARYDFSGNGVVGFADWLMFLDTFGNSSSSSKPVLANNGMNTQALLSLIGSDRPSIDQSHIALTVQATGLTAMQGYMATISYDPSKLTFVRAVRAHQTVMPAAKDAPGLTILSQTEGRIVVTDAVVDGQPISGSGLLADLVFELLAPVDPSAVEIEIAQIFDPENGINQAAHMADLAAPQAPSYTTALQGNFPNPFNPSTTIRYSVAEAGNVRIVLYNALGQEVRTLVDNQKLAGDYSVQWNGLDNSGRQAASGVYVTRMETNGFTATHQMVLLK
jgi:hypothetical protein